MFITCSKTFANANATVFANALAKNAFANATVFAFSTSFCSFLGLFPSVAFPYQLR